MSKVPHVIDIARKAHQGQFDKAGEPYINHPLRVMEKMTTEEEKIVAILRDVVEDANSADWPAAT